MPDDRARPPTIRTVAARAKVSKSLVSLVLRGSPHVSPAKREAVETAIAELGFRPNAIARTLTERRTRLVGVLLNDLRNPWFVDCLQSITAVLHDHGLRTLFTDGRLDRAVEDAALQGLLELRVDGLVLLGTTVATPVIADAASRVPTVVAASRDVELPAVDVVANDDAVGARLAVEHLARARPPADRPPGRDDRRVRTAPRVRVRRRHARGGPRGVHPRGAVRRHRGGRLPSRGAPAGRRR